MFDTIFILLILPLLIIGTSIIIYFISDEKKADK